MVGYTSKVTHDVALYGRTPPQLRIGALHGGKTAKTKTAHAGAPDASAIQIAIQI
jgi:hypothetical protein